ncbi:CsbD-like [Serratia grimesii]|uniref:CsbD family protein n=1 Tax=Serratia grimesii TaxID=82995 RepID=UPI000E073E56|nr:CsbD family protein [Serratia grimesii]SUI34143.1 CsbD-like [Serratia grimesii]
MNSDKINGVMDKVVGKAQEAAGDMTGDEQLQAEGTARYVAGTVQEKYGDALNCISDVVRKKTHHYLVNLCRCEFIGRSVVTSSLRLI